MIHSLIIVFIAVFTVMIFESLLFLLLSCVDGGIKKTNPLNQKSEKTSALRKKSLTRQRSEFSNLRTDLSLAPR